MRDDRILIGLRRDDLDEADARRLGELLATSDEARREHEGWQPLGQALRSLPGTPGPSLQHVLERASARTTAAPQLVAPRRSWAPWAGILALAAAAALTVLALPDQGVRDRGVGDGRADVHLQAAATGPGGLRPLGEGSTVRPEERVLFQVATSTEGALTLEEHAGDVQVVYPDQGAWTVAEGTHAPGGETVLSWRPDTHLDQATYVATLCPVEDACVTDRLTLRWSR